MKLHKNENYHPVITQKRVANYNMLWDKTKLVIEAAKIIHSDNLSKLKRYLLPRNSTKPSSTKIVPGAMVIVLNNGLDENTVFEIKNTGKSPLQFYVIDKKDAGIPPKCKVISYR